ncbi:hypothetical protein [Nocardiopsis trehalosi]|jgi:hypothetical protein|uniref:hypothetical protein n=1 Tax=Nocardiopsis trehalosi TaxID=109329 RepID=UPI00082C0BF8|nr:hypothetical protein [Nocardiopsis trehalosi]
MGDGTWAALQATDIAEVRRRAAVISDFVGVAPQTVHGAERLAWVDYGGQAAVWFFAPEGLALLLTFDHESDLNLCGDADFAAQRALYDGVPEDLLRFVRDPADNHETPVVKDPETGGHLQCAGGVFWFDGERWAVADGMLDYCEAEDIDLDESGFEHAMGDYLFGREFTPEAFVARRDAFGYYANDANGASRRAADLAELRDLIARHA